jgi:DNA-binding transcriptional LysR family regulator
MAIRYTAASPSSTLLMELRHLRYFVAVADALHFTRAAKQLGIGQPPLSQQIKQLEQEIGSPLFERLPRGIRLTTVGEVFLLEARDILARAHGAIESARRAARGETGLLRLGYAASAAFHPLLSRFAHVYRERYPEVRLTLVEGNTAKLSEELANAALDMALIRPPYTLPENFICERLIDEAMLVALPAGHRLANARSIKLSQLADDSFLLFPRHIGMGLFDGILQACVSAGFVPRVEQEAPQMASIISLVAGGLGVALVPECMQKIHDTGVIYKRLAGEAPRAWLDVAHDRRNAPAVVVNAVRVLREVA